MFKKIESGWTQLHATKNHGFELIEFLSINEENIQSYSPIAGSFAVISCSGKYLMCYNDFRKQWELPAGQREACETSKACAIRELFEETGQVVEDMKFIGLLKLKNVLNGQYKYNPVYFTSLDRLQPFVKNNETSIIKLWDLKEAIGFVDDIDIQVVEIIEQLNKCLDQI